MLNRKNIKIFWIVYLFIYTGCASQEHRKRIETSEGYVSTKVLYRPKPLKQTLKPGETIYILFVFPRFNNTKVNSHENWELFCNNKKQIFFLINDKGGFYLSETYFSKLKPYKCILRNKFNKQNFEIVKVKVKTKVFTSEKLRVAKRKIDLSKDDLKRVIKERKMLFKLYEQLSRNLKFKSPFVTPLSSHITSFYGAKRLFNNKKVSQHLGVDFRAKVGISIPVANSGKVIFAGNLFYSGNVVIVDHGGSIVSTYAHLSEIFVKKGDDVFKMDIIGKSGSTGRVSGPHLHWGLKIQGNWVDGLFFIKLLTE